MAEKKPRKSKLVPPNVVFEPIAASAMPPMEFNEIQHRLALRAFAKAPGGRIVGIRPRADGPTDLLVFESGAATGRVVSTGDLKLGAPDISADGTRALCYRREPSPGLVEIDLGSGAITVLTTDGPPLMEPVYVAADRIVALANKRPVLLRRTAAGTETAATLDAVKEASFTSVVLGGKYVVVESLKVSFLLAIKGDALHLIKKTNRSKEPMSSREGRLFVHQGKAGWAEAANLAKLWEELG